MISNTKFEESRRILKNILNNLENNSNFFEEIEKFNYIGYCLISNYFQTQIKNEKHKTLIYSF